MRQCSGVRHSVAIVASAIGVGGDEDWRSKLKGNV